VRRHALALFIPTQHCIGGASALRADEHGFARRSAAAEDGCGLVHRIQASIIYEWLKTHYL
jgi:hypothetical protein